MNGKLVLAVVSCALMPAGALALEEDPSRAGQEQQSHAAQSHDARSQHGTAADKLMDLRALNRLHHANQKQMELARLAMKNGQSEDVKNVAQRILSEHQKLEKQLETLAGSEQVALQKFQFATHEQASFDHMKKLSGTEFDREILRTLQLSHRQAVGDLERLQTRIANAKVKSLMQDTVASMNQLDQTVARVDLSSKTRVSGSR